MDREVQPLGEEEIEDLAPPRCVRRRERGDAADVEPVCPRQPDAAHRAVVVPIAALAVGDLAGAVEARADLHAVLAKEIAELVVEQPQVALQGDVAAPAAEARVQPVERLADDRVAGHQRLAAVEGDLRFAQASLIRDPRDEVECGVHRVGGHHRPVVRPEAVRARGGTTQRRHEHEVRLRRAGTVTVLITRFVLITDDVRFALFHGILAMLKC